MKLIDLLVKIENKTLKDNARVIIDDKLYYYNSEDKKFYTTPNDKFQYTYRNICTYELDLPFEIIDKQEIKEEDKPEKIEPLNPISLEQFKTMNLAEGSHATMIEYDKIEELRNTVNYLLEKSI